MSDSDKLSGGSAPHQVDLVQPDDAHPFGEIPDIRMRAFLVAYAGLSAECPGGVKYRAAAAAGIDPSLIYTPRWRNNEAFQGALVRAYEMAGEKLEDAARQRAVEGMRQYKHTKDGIALRHPTVCECGHGLELHPRARDPGESTKRPCLHPECVHPENESRSPCHDFLGEPYYETVYSDRLLEKLLGAAYPDRYSKKVEVETRIFQNIDMNRMPDHVVDAIANGKNVLEVLLRAAQDVEEAGRVLAQSGVEVGTFGSDEERAELEERSVEPDAL